MFVKPPQLGFGFAPEGGAPIRAWADYNEYHRDWRKKNRARLQAERLALYASRKKAALCPPCGRPRDADGLKLCSTCTNKRDKKKLAARQQSTRFKRKAAGLCVACGDKAEDGKTFCRACLRVNNERIKQTYKARREAGLCERLGCNEPPVSTETRCQKHKLHSNSQRRDRYTPEKGRKGQLKTRFGLTTEQWNTMFESQGKRCSICGSATPKSSIGWATDHDHATGRVRGVLCCRCNIGLGGFEDNPDSLARAIEYLRKHRLSIVV